MAKYRHKPTPKGSPEHPLSIAFRLLRSMGTAGEIIWEVAKTIDDGGERLEYINKAVAWLREKARNKNFRVPPFDFRTFCESPRLLDKAGALWPEVMREGEEINSGKYTEVVLTGAIGVAKSTLALYTQAYQIYVVSCMKAPHEVFDLDTASEILIVFQSINKNLAVDVDYRRFRSMVQDSPYFTTEFPFNRDRESDMRFNKFNLVVKPVAGHDTAAIGQNVIGGILDELNFMEVVQNSKQSKDGGMHDQAVKNYNSIARRRESRFMQLGMLPGMLCLVSSRNYPGQFTDKKEEESREQRRKQGFSTIYVYDKRLWEVRPERYLFHSGQRNEARFGKDHPFWFHVFIGDATRKPKIIEDLEKVPPGDRSLVMPIPIEHLQAFENDLLPALRDVAGVATQALHPFMINTDAVAACFGKVSSILSRDDCDFVETHLQVFPKRIKHPNELRFAHIDLAVTKDSAGISIGHVPGFRSIDRGDYAEVLPIIQLDCILEVFPPRGGEIEFENIRRLIYALRDKLRLPIKWVTFDQYQSRDSMQIMFQQGFMTGYQSMDVDTFAYDVTKQALYDGRVLAPFHEKARRELISLEFDPKKQKIDHPPNGSKDVSDSIAGVVAGLTMRREIWVRHGIPTNRLPRTVLEARQNRNSITAKEKALEHAPA